MEQKKLLHVLARHDQFLRRVARMLAAGNRGDTMPKDAEFHPEEVQHLDSASFDLVVEILGAEPNKIEWLPPGQYPYEKEYWKRPGHLNWLEAYQEGLLRSKNYLSVYLVAESNSEVHMGDKITVGAAHVVMGSGAQAGNLSTHGSVRRDVMQPEQLVELADQLAKLRKELRAASDPENSGHDVELGAVAQAEKSARAGDGPAMLAHLKNAGQWCLDVATKIGVNLATEAIKQSTGLDK